jgi:hypothetical protein
MRWETIVLHDYYQSHKDSMYNTDLLRGYEAYHIKITDIMPGTIF